MDTFQQLALDFNMPDENFNPDFVPENGEQYLQKVVYERQHCPAIVSVAPKIEIDVKNSKENKSVVNDYIAKHQIVNNAPSVLYPTKEWEELQSQEFTELVDKVNQMRNLSSKLNELPDLPDLPDIDDTQGWLEFCRNNVPLLRHVLRIDQRCLETLFEYLLEWLNDEVSVNTAIDINNSEFWLGSWIYASLVCLRLPLEPNIHSVIREIAKICIKLRNDLTSEDTVKAASLNSLICIIANNFKQFDLSVIRN